MIITISDLINFKSIFWQNTSNKHIDVTQAHKMKVWLLGL